MSQGSRLTVWSRRGDRRFPRRGGHPRAVIWVTWLQSSDVQAGGARFRPLQNCTIRGQSPRRCGQSCARESALEAGWHGLPVSFTVKRSRVRACVCPPRTARRRRRTGGEEVEGATPCFLALVRHRAGEMVHAKVHHLPPRFWGRSLHSDPWREGHRAPFRAHGG